VHENKACDIPDDIFINYKKSNSLTYNRGLNHYMNSLVSYAY